MLRLPTIKHVILLFGFLHLVTSQTTSLQPTLSDHNTSSNGNNHPPKPTTESSNSKEGDTIQYK